MRQTRPDESRRGTQECVRYGEEEGGPQQTSMAVSLRNTRIAIRARVTRAALPIDINDSMAEQPPRLTEKWNNSFYRANQVSLLVRKRADTALSL
jgi:hypothetical protein